MLLSTLYIMWAVKAAKFEVTVVNGLGGYAFTRKYII